MRQQQQHSTPETIVSVLRHKIAALQMECDMTRAGPTSKQARETQMREDVDPSALPFVLPKSERHSRMSNRRAESVAELRRKEMPTSFTVPSTDHVTIPHFLTEQLRRAALLGIVDLKKDRHGKEHASNGSHNVVEAGPSPFPQFDTKDYTGPAPPKNVADLFVDPSTWDTIVDFAHVSIWILNLNISDDLELTRHIDLEARIY